MNFTFCQQLPWKHVFEKAVTCKYELDGESCNLKVRIRRDKLWVYFDVILCVFLLFCRISISIFREEEEEEEEEEDNENLIRSNLEIIFCLEKHYHLLFDLIIYIDRLGSNMKTE